MGYPVIENREFYFENVFQAEIMVPRPITRNVPAYYTGCAIQFESNMYSVANVKEIISDDQQLMYRLSSSQDIVQRLRSSRQTVGVLIAISALATSFQPLVDKYSKSRVPGLILTSIGILAALASILAVFLEWTLNWMDVAASKRLSREPV